MTATSELEARIKELEQENRRLRAGVFAPSGPTVIVPEALRSVFDAAQRTVGRHFEKVQIDPGRSTIQIGDERYILLRASALSIDFFDTIVGLYADRGEAKALAICKSFLFDIAHSIGIHDARRFHRAMDLEDPVERLSAGPVHFAYTGWALVDIQPSSTPVSSDDYYLCYDHPYSFEAASWLRAGRHSTTPVCVMNAGYSSGWCEESFGLPLTAVEVRCRAKGDSTCTFAMAPPHRMVQQLQKHFGTEYEEAGTGGVSIPTYFDRKRAEEAREKLIGELQLAMAKIKTLRGLIPICCSCKKVRDDEGYWHQVEAYIGRHSEAEFSHGLCPECRAALYPEKSIAP